MAQVQRWRFVDPVVGEEWTVPINPREMDSPFKAKNVTSKTTTAIDGRPIMFEGNAPPREWGFSGVTLNTDHYAELRRWVEDKSNPIYIYDHLGRRLEVYLTEFGATPQEGGKRTVGAPVRVDDHWKHTYTVSGLVIGVADFPVST